jgi:hypothetical protein
LPALAVLVLALAACSGSTVVLKKIGAACAADADCGSGMCRSKVCTKLCASQQDCPKGADCGLANAGDTEATCYTAAWDTTSPGGFGTSCSQVAQGCTNDPSPCGTAFHCLATAKCDADAYCSKECAGDRDCPPAFFCGWNGPKTDATTKRYCFKRGSCAPCLVDDQCGADAACNLDPNGVGYCAKACSGAGDCLKPFKQVDESTGRVTVYPPFEECATDAYGREQKVCAPAKGVCFGPSTLGAIHGDGQVCSPCRFGLPDDCASGLRCLDVGTGERFCSQSCKIKLVQDAAGNYGLRDDNCPTGSFCFFGGGVDPSCGASCTVDGICAGDPTYLGPTCYPNTK